MKNFVRRGLIFLGLALVGVPAASAQQTVRGQVISAETRAPLPGVAVRAKDTERGTLTDAQGRYLLTLPPGTEALVFSSIGHATEEVAVEGREVIDVALQPAAVQLDRVVVVGYTTQERGNISGSVASVSAEEIAERPVARLEEALQGRIAGVNIVNSGEPGRPSQVIIRGQNFIGNVAPLYVVDGMYMRQNPNLDPNDVASVEVLKDASAASQYGAQAANGVIVITTKRGAAQQTQMTLNSYYGFQEIPRKVQTMRAAEYVQIANAAADAAGRPRIPANDEFFDPSIDTDWQEELFRRGGIQNHNLTLSGATENASYLISGSYLDQLGAIVDTDFRRYSLRINSELRKGRFTLGENLALSRAEQDEMVGFPLIDAMMLPPTLPVRDPNNVGGFAIGSGFNPTFGTNPIGLQETVDLRNARNQALGTLYAGVHLLDNLDYRFNFGFTADMFSWRNFTEEAALRQNTQVFPDRLWERREHPYSLLFENLLTFDDSFGAHDLNAVAGYTEQKSAFNRLEAFRQGFPFDGVRQLDAGTENFGNRGFQVENALRSFLFRTNYSFADRYLATLSFRRDGSSRFGPENKWGNFGAVSLGWVLSEEGFYPSIPLLGAASNHLKVRGSYGTLGNQDIGDYQYAALINQGWGSGYIFDQQLTPGGIQTGLANPRIRWQENTMANIGFDLGLFENQLSLTADYYIAESGGLLVRAPLPPSLGVGGGEVPYVNAGSVRNSGFELELSHRLSRGDMGLHTTANLTTTKNRVLSLGNDAQPLFAGPWGVARTAVGLPIGHWYLRKMDGIFQNEEEVQAHRNSEGIIIQPNARPGDVRWADLNDDGLINDEDRYVAGSGIPELEGNLFFDGNFRRLDFSLGLRGSYGAEIFNVARFWRDRMDDVGGAYSADLQPWTPENPSTTTPRAILGEQGIQNSFPVTDRWLEDGSFLRIQNLILGYNLPERALSRIGVPGAGMRVYVNMNNLHTFTRYTGWDPEALGFNNPLARGLDDGRIFPNVRTISVGADLTF